MKSTGLFRSLFASEPAGWGRRTKRRIFAIREELAGHVQRLNDLYADPDGHDRAPGTTSADERRERTDTGGETP